MERLTFLLFPKTCYLFQHFHSQYQDWYKFPRAAVMYFHTFGIFKFLKRCKYQTILPTSWEICLQVKKQQLELDMEQQTGFKLGKKYIKAVYCHLAY